MENRYLFRGKRTDNGEWVEWNMLTGIPHDAHILSSTICQCTGYDGIYEKDIFEAETGIFVIKWSENLLEWIVEKVYSSETIPLYEFSPKEIDVIGNEIDNPGLLEV